LASQTSVAGSNPVVRFAEPIRGDGQIHRGVPSPAGLGRASAGYTSLLEIHEGGNVLAIAGTGYGIIGILVIVLLVVLILYFVRRA